MTKCLSKKYSAMCGIKHNQNKTRQKTLQYSYVCPAGISQWLKCDIFLIFFFSIFIRKWDLNECFRMKIILKWWLRVGKYLTFYINLTQAMLFSLVWYFAARLRPGIFWHTSQAHLSIRGTQNHQSQSLITHSPLIFICPESRRTYVTTVSKILFFPIELKLFFSTFWTSRTKKM